MLRITDQMGQLTSQYDLARAQYRLALQHREASSGLRINQAADDPSGAASLIRIEDELQEVEQSQKNISQTKGEVDTGESTLATASELLVRARELSIAMSNGSFTASERAEAAEEIRDIREQMLSLANTRYNGRYIFGGYQTDAQPFDPGGSWVGDDNERKILAAPGLEVTVGVTGRTIFAPPSGQDIFAVLNTLTTDLETNNIAGVSASTSSLGAAQEQVTSVRARLGITATRLSSLNEALGNQQLQLEASRSQIGEADAVDSLSELARAQQALTAAIKVSGSMLSRLSLVDKL